MSEKILMPALSPTMEKGNLTNWIKKDGDFVQAGDVIAEIETDKATMEVEASDEGRLKIIIQAGTKDIPVKSLIGLLLEEDEEVSNEELQNLLNTNSPMNKPVGISDTLVNNESTINIENTNSVKLNHLEDGSSNIQHDKYSRVFVSPVAKRIAKNSLIDLNSITGSGPRGRIIKRDVLKYIDENSQLDSSINSKQDRIDEPSNMQKIIAKRLVESKNQAPHFYLKSDCCVDELLLLRKKINNSASLKVTINDLIVKIIATSMLEFEDINSSWQQEKIVRKGNIDIAIAVSTEDGGIMTPVIRNVDKKNLLDISRETSFLIERARKGQVTPQECNDGSITISNLGMYRITEFSAIINPPQSSIVAIGSIKKSVYADENNNIKVMNSINCNISCDHRVINGHIAALWISKIKELIENPVCALI